MSKSEIRDIFVPGRICLFGEHSDWAGIYRKINGHIYKGRTIISGTDVGIYAKVKKHENLKITLTEKIKKEHLLPLNLEILKNEAQNGGFFSYVAGVAYQIKKKFPFVGGIEINNYKNDLPMKKGLSSSAAICVLTVRSFNILYGLGLSIDEEMELAYLGEITTPSKCGRMDQGCAYGNKLVSMTFDGEQLSTNVIKSKVPLYLVIVDLAASKDTTTILKDLQACYPVAKDDTSKGVQYLFGEKNWEITEKAIKYIEDGDIENIGKLMVEAQKLFDMYAIKASPEQLTAPILHQLLNDENVKKLTLGGKGVGSQGDGSAQFLLKNENKQKELIEYLKLSYPLMHTFSVTIPSNEIV